MTTVFCVSYYSGSLDVLRYSSDHYFIYFKGQENYCAFKSFPDNRKAWISNTGFNLKAYFTYIVSNYEALPEVVVFCKNNVFPRHVSEEVFARLSKRNVYTPIVQQSTWHLLRFPISVLSSVGDYLELNNDWYVNGVNGRYFKSFNNFFKFLFPGAPIPTYLRFGPGANIVVPRSHILLRSKFFYQNLITFMDYDPFAIESYFIERGIDAIFNLPYDENPLLSRIMSGDELNSLELEAVNSRGRINLLFKYIRSFYYLTSRLGDKFFRAYRE